jgi:hypothetical protein
MSIPEKLCIFCEHFDWTAEEMWGMGSTMTGPMFDGGWAKCRKGHYGDYGDLEAPKDESDYRRVILRGMECKDYQQVAMPSAAVEKE